VLQHADSVRHEVAPRITLKRKSELGNVHIADIISPDSFYLVVFSYLYHWHASCS
jgi:hypothetical protein